MYHDGAFKVEKRLFQEDRVGVGGREDYCNLPAWVHV